MNDGTAEAELAGRVSAAMYAKDRAAQMLGIQLRTVRHGYAELTMTVREDMLNVHGLCHGGLVFALADTAFGYACHTRNQANVALQGAISFTAPARLGDELIAVAEQRAQGGWRLNRASRFLLCLNRASRRYRRLKRARPKRLQLPLQAPWWGVRPCPGHLGRARQACPCPRRAARQESVSRKQFSYLRGAIESTSYPHSCCGPRTLEDARATALLSVAQSFVGWSHLHVLVVEGFLVPLLFHPGRLPESCIKLNDGQVPVRPEAPTLFT